MAMKRIVLECENDINHTYGELNLLLNTSDNDDMDSVYQRVKHSMDKLLRLNTAYTSYAEMYAKALSQFNEQHKKAEESSPDNDEK